MSSGKQTSFSFGEISPEFHYQADSNMFTNGLKRVSSCPLSDGSNSGS